VDQPAEWPRGEGEVDEAAKEDANVRKEDGKTEASGIPKEKQDAAKDPFVGTKLLKRRTRQCIPAPRAVDLCARFPQA
jgi:hypothetical protein